VFQLFFCSNNSQKFEWMNRVNHWRFYVAAFHFLTNSKFSQNSNKAALLEITSKKIIQSLLFQVWISCLWFVPIVVPTTMEIAIPIVVIAVVCSLATISWVVVSSIHVVVRYCWINWFSIRHEWWLSGWCNLICAGFKRTSRLNRSIAVVALLIWLLAILKIGSSVLKATGGTSCSILSKSLKRTEKK